MAQGGADAWAWVSERITHRMCAGGGKLLESIWKQCLDHLEAEIPLHQFDTWLRPLQVEASAGELRLLAPNQYVRDWVDENYSQTIRRALTTVGGGSSPPCRVTVAVGSLSPSSERKDAPRSELARRDTTGLQPSFTFSSFIEGKSNQLARAAALQVAENPGSAYNPFLIYGATGLGKTHLMHAIGNVTAKRPAVRVAYLPSMDFVRNMVSSIRHNRMDRFYQYYRSIHVLLIDDVQFFAGKTKSHEELFHIINDLLRKDHQVVVTCDRSLKDVPGLPERLTSRFESGIFFTIDPPELETRAAILKSKAETARIDLPDDVALFLADKLKSNVRELEAALRRVILGSEFHGKPISIAYCREVLQDLLAIYDRLVTVENIQKTVADYFKLRISDLISKRRSRSIVRPRQLAMALARELTNCSFPEIGEKFGNRDHTTVLHACRKVEELRKTENLFDTDYQNLLSQLRR